MVGHLNHSRGPAQAAQYAVLIALCLLPSALIAQQGGECSGFVSEFCNMNLANIIMLESNITNPAECQEMCFKRDACVKFSHFVSDEATCILFKRCQAPYKPCRNCVSGPPYPRISRCQREPLRNEQDFSRNSIPALPAVPEPGVKQPKCFSGSCFAVCPACQQPSNQNNPNQENANQPNNNNNDNNKNNRSNNNNNSNKRPNNDRNKSEESEAEDEEYMDPYGEDGGFDKDEDYDEEGFSGDDDEEDNNVNVDDGLLDDVFSEIPGNNNNNNRRNNDNSKNNNSGNRNNGNRNRNNNKSEGSQPNCPTCPSFNTGFFYCVMGGSNQFGPVAGISLLNTGGYAIPRTPLISAFPPSMTKGSGSTFSTFTGRALMTCTPGYAVTGLTPASTFGGFGGGFISQTYIPGTCNSYDFNSRNWQSTGGKLTTVREGGSTLRVGSYLVSLGGVSPTSGYPVTSIEIFDSRRANLGWKNVPRWSFPSATRDHCTVMTRNSFGQPEMMVIGGEGREASVTKMVLSTGQWFSLPSMAFPRRQHACSKVNMNGRPGVVVSGGAQGNLPNTTSVEFYDINSGQWLNLPSLDRSRRGHTMTTIDGSLAVAGGSSGTGRDTEFLDDVEVFDGKRWKRATYGLGGSRNGANLVKLPFNAVQG